MNNNRKEITVNKKERIINEILEMIRNNYLMESGLVQLTKKGLMKCNNDTLNNLLFLIEYNMISKGHSQLVNIKRYKAKQAKKGNK